MTLRRKLLLLLGSLVFMFLAVSVTAIVLLHDAAGDILQIEETGPELAASLNALQRTVLGLGIVFMVLLNISIILVLRTATMILGPVNALIEAARMLEREKFDYRIKLDRADEFGELARSYNTLAERLQSNERKKIETLQQMSRTLNHELNNALAIIDLQLRVVEKSTSEDSSSARALREIHEALARMGRTVSRLKQVRRIVLTEYVSGVQMLDLERSVEEDSPTPGAPETPGIPETPGSPEPLVVVTTERTSQHDHSQTRTRHPSPQ